MEINFNWADKKELRQYYSAKRSTIPLSTRQLWSDEACNHAVTLIQQLQIGSIMLYVPFRSELDVSPLMNWCLASALKVIVPKCRISDHSMTLHQIYSNDDLEQGSYGIWEPVTDPLSMNEISNIPQLIIVPGLIFDETGGRLGYGGGYYDRLYEKLQGQPIYWMGIGFEQQMIEHVPTERHDITLNGMITEQRYILYDTGRK